MRNVSFVQLLFIVIHMAILYLIGFLFGSFQSIFYHWCRSFENLHKFFSAFSCCLRTSSTTFLSSIVCVSKEHVRLESPPRY